MGTGTLGRWASGRLALPLRHNDSQLAVVVYDRPMNTNGASVRLLLDPDALAERRLQACLTQVSLAAKVGVHPITMTRYETGAMNPRPSVIKRLAKALGCGVPDIAFIDEG